jgi:predicted RNA binding protein YcfA (HicA-like mRNA interferase family)
MSKIEKLIALFLSEPAEVRFSDAEKLLENFGFQKDRTRGSHNIFSNPKTKKQIVIPTVSGKKVKQRYVKEINKLLDLEQL